MKDKKQPIVFDNGPQDEFAEGEQIMDVLIHYAQSGIQEAEKVMREEPDFFTQEEIMDFAASKAVLSKAPDIIDEYKRKFREFNQLHDKVQSVVKKCEHIVHDYEGRQRTEEPQEVSVQGAKSAAAAPRLESTMIRYGEDGKMIVKKDKKVVIELPKKD